MARTRQFAGGKRALLLAAASVALSFAAEPVLAQTADPDAPTAFGQAMPQQYLVNRMTNPAPSHTSGGGSGSASGGAAQAGGQTVAVDDEATNGDSPYPKRYLFNRLFGGGGNSAPSPAAAEPAPTATPPAAKTP